VIFIAAGATTAELARSVRGPYVALAACAFGMALLTRFVHLPDLIEKGETKAEGHWTALRFRNLRLGAVGIFTYVGAEVAIGSIMINFLGQPQMGGMSHEQAAQYVSLYWGAAMIGRLIGFFVQQKVRAEKALTFVTVIAAVLIATVMVTHGPVAMWAAVSCGLFNSVMWPCIFPLAVEGLGPYTSQGSGILITMVVGGAVIPGIQGLLADKLGYQHSFVIVLACYLYLIFFAVSGHKSKVKVSAETELV
jgi:MFS transporter, FHS family, L-fucose permease